MKDKQNNEQYNLNHEEFSEIDKQQQKELKNIKKEEKARNKEISSEKRALKNQAKESRRDLGNYYFYELNRNNFSKFKIIEVKVLFWAALLFSINLLFAAAFSVTTFSSSVDVATTYKTAYWVFSGLILLFVLVNRLIQSILSNISSNNISLIIQRIFGIVFIILLFGYFLITMLILANSTSLVHQGWLVFNILITWVFIIAQTMFVSLYGNKL